MRTKIKVISATAPLAHTPMMTSITELKLSLIHIFGLTGEEHIHIDPITGIDDKTEPAGWNLRFVAIRGHQQIRDVYKRQGFRLSSIGRQSFAFRHNGFGNRSLLFQKFLDVYKRQIKYPFSILVSLRIEKDWRENKSVAAVSSSFSVNQI